MLRAKVEEQKQKAFDLNQGAAQYAILKHEVDATQSLYETLQLKLRQAGIVAGLASANIGVVEPGQVPSEPIDPRPALDLALGLGCGLVLGVLSAVGMEALDSTVRTGEEVESACGLPILAVIPQIKLGGSAARARGDLPLRQSQRLRLIAYELPRSHAAESYRSLRTSLLLPSAARPPQVLVVTSSMPAEGKTLTAVNCATVLAQQGAKVLLVDSDLRQPSLHQAFQLPQEPGLSNVLMGGCPVEEAISRTDILPSLSLLPSGPADGCLADRLASPKMLDLLDYWRSHYDHIVLDTPPVSMFTDAVLLGAHADAVLLVARSGATTKYSLRHACDLLQRAKLNLAGVVLNGMDQQYERSYYRRYGYGRGNEARFVDN